MRKFTKNFFWIISILLSVSCCAYAQGQMKYQEVKYTNLRVEVISIFEKTNDIVLLKVLQVKDTSFPAAAGAEILTRFAFSTKARPQFNLPGVQKGDKLKAQIAIDGTNQNEQYQYRVLRYFLQAAKKDAESR